MSRLQKRPCAPYPCRVCAHECTMEQESVQRDGCKCWLLQDCIGMTLAQYAFFSQVHLQFFCPRNTRKKGQRQRPTAVRMKRIVQ